MDRVPHCIIHFQFHAAHLCVFVVSAALLAGCVFVCVCVCYHGKWWMTHRKSRSKAEREPKLKTKLLNTEQRMPLPRDFNLNKKQNNIKFDCLTYKRRIISICWFLFRIFIFFLSVFLFSTLFFERASKVNWNFLLLYFVRGSRRRDPTMKHL